MAVVPVGLRGAPPAGPVGRRRRAAADGAPVLDRALRGAPGPDPGGRAGDRHQHGRHRRLLRRDRAPSSRRPWTCSAAVRYDQVFAAAYSPRPGTPATQPAPTTSRRRSSASASTALLALQEEIGFERNRERIGTHGVGPRGRRRPRRGPTTTRTTRPRTDATPLTLAGEDPFARAAAGRLGPPVRPLAREQARPPARAPRSSSAGSSTPGSSAPGRTACAASSA